ncbi:MAG: hypothetical protein AB7T49_10985 [Oligoflexales bacterium]
MKLRNLVIALVSLISVSAFAGGKLKANQKLCDKFDDALEVDGKEVDLLGVAVSEDGKSAFAVVHVVTFRNEYKEINLELIAAEKNGSKLELGLMSELEGFEPADEAELELIAIGQGEDGKVLVQTSNNSEIDKSTLLTIESADGYDVTTDKLETKRPIATENGFICH